MGAEKTTAIILALAPYRETSCLVRLFTEAHGLVHGIAKGVRKDMKSVSLDRGFLIELLVYIKPNRDLHTLGGVQVINFYPLLRGDITRSAIRDTALELYLKSITQSSPHPELYQLLVHFLESLENSRRDLLFPLLWHFIHQYCSLSGFHIQTDRCAACGGDTEGTGGMLQISRGALVCPVCAPRGDNQSCLQPSIVRFLDRMETDQVGISDARECLRITRLLLSYCRHHLDIRSSFNALDFMEAHLSWEAGKLGSQEAWKI